MKNVKCNKLGVNAFVHRVCKGCECDQQGSAEKMYLPTTLMKAPLHTSNSDGLVDFRPRSNYEASKLFLAFDEYNCEEEYINEEDVN